MGISSSKTEETGFKIDYSNAAFNANEVKRQALLAAADASDKTEEALSWAYKPFIWLFGLAFLAVAGILAYDVIAMSQGWRTILLPNDKPNIASILFIDSAQYGTVDPTSKVFTSLKDVGPYLYTQVQNENTLPSFTVGCGQLGLNPCPLPPNTSGTLNIKYHVGNGASCSLTFNDGEICPQLPEITCGGTTGPSAADRATRDTAPPPFLTKLYSSIFGDSSGELSPSFHDATSSANIKGNEAPLSAQRDGGYGMQWWMYIKDWNYGYGKKKAVLRRSDTTNKGINNPDISLHPTDNSLQISVSIYPATEGGAAKDTPAPAGHSGSSDDVFVCDVQNIPLQTWFSVSVTVFGRNLDVYIDGKLVKSCFLTGVPKPALGDISLTPDGGFSGRICGYYHYPKMLTPSDAMSFWAAGTSCRNKTASGGGPGAATGYSVKFGMYDALGKEVTEYAF